ncbi:hypothetical protein ACIO6T_39145 [Streptomyces sp. NPDC087532]|uniref:hypothetical protein n=1 Tax=Streptomyces sp. NPDC087532 TaxID=3365795 RepID=UPI003800EADA
MTQYLPTHDLEQARVAADMAEFCRAAELPVPRIHPDTDGQILSAAGEMLLEVSDEPPGTPPTAPVSVASAEHIGHTLGRTHRVLASYPLPRATRPTRWTVGDVLRSLRRWERTLSQLGPGNRPARELLNALRQHGPGLAAEPAWDDLTRHAVHGEFTRTNLKAVCDAIQGVVGFRAQEAHLSWELSRIAYEPQNVARDPQWMRPVLAFFRSYWSANPTLPLEDLTASARIASLRLLHAAPRPWPAHQPAAAPWHLHTEALRRLLVSIDAIDSALMKMATTRERGP